MFTGLVFLGVLLVPGHLIANLINLRKYQFVFSISFSYAYFLTIVMVGRYFEFSLDQATQLFLVTILVLAVFAISFRGWREILDSLHVASLFSKFVHPSTIVVTGLALVIYHYIAGIYDEVPADLYKHLEYATSAFLSISEHGFGEDSGISFIPGEGQRDFYILVAWVALITNAEIYEIYPAISIIGVAVFIFGFLSVADRLYQAFRFSSVWHQTAILSGVLFASLQMGLTVFSFIRYYSFAPTMLNFVLYFTGLIVLLDLFECKSNRLRSVIVLIIVTATSAEIHFQESMFILTALVLLTFWKLVQGVVGNHEEISHNSRRLHAIVLVGFTLGLLLIYLWIRLKYPIRSYSHSEVLETGFRYIGRVFYLDPGYKFYQVMTIWGVLVYGLTLVHIRRLIPQPFLILAMVSPVVTLFNPLVIEMFMRLGKSTVVWRFGYFVPIHLVAGAIVVFLLSKLREKSIISRVFSLVSMFLLLCFLLPSLAGFHLNSYAKTTLSAVSDRNSWRNWSDLIEYVHEYDRAHPDASKLILTDPITAYMIGAFTKFESYNYKFIPSRAYYQNQFSLADYTNFPLEKYQGKLLIVNNRTGDVSPTGKHSKHWDENVLRLTDYYTPELSEHLENNPDRFNLLWSANKIAVYLVL